MLHWTIHDDDFKRNAALQHCCEIVLNACTVATLCCAKNGRCESSCVTSPYSVKVATISRFVEDVNTRQRLPFSFPEL